MIMVVVVSISSDDQQHGVPGDGDEDPRRNNGGDCSSELWPTSSPYRKPRSAEAMTARPCWPVTLNAFIGTNPRTKVTPFYKASFM